MRNDTIVTLAGLVATEPERKEKDGVALLSFRLVATPSRFDKATGSWVDGESTWATVDCWRRLAVNAGDSIRKGDRIVVHGRMRTRQWEQDGVRRSAVSVTADALGPDLNFGVTIFERRSRHDPARDRVAAADELAVQVEDASDDLPPIDGAPPIEVTALPYEPDDDETPDDEDYEREEVRSLVGVR